MIEALLFNKTVFILFAISYLIGSIPVGYLIFKYKNKSDIRKFGSGNIGATNVNRLLGKKSGLITLLLDFSKTYLPTLLVYKFFGIEVGVLCGILSILGHMFPVWLKFKGGKGVAGFIAFLLLISWPLCIIYLLIWIISVKIFKYSALGAITATLLNVLLFKISLFLQFKYNILLWLPGEPIEFYFVAFISLLIIFKHKKNIISFFNK